METVRKKYNFNDAYTNTEKVAPASQIGRVQENITRTPNLARLHKPNRTLRLFQSCQILFDYNRCWRATASDCY